MGWEGDVLNKNVNRLKVDAAKEVKGGILGLIGVATGGLLGKQPEGQQPVADRNGVLPRAASAGTDAAKQATDSLRRFGQQQGIGVPEQTGQTGLGAFLGRIGDSFSRRILPSDGMVKRLEGGATAITGTVTGIAAGGAALVQGGVDAVKKAASLPTAAEIADKVAKGELDGHTAQKMINAGLVQLPDASTIKHQKPAPVEDRSFRAAAADATAAPERSLMDRARDGINSGVTAMTNGVAAVATAVTVAAAPAPAAATPVAPTPATTAPDPKAPIVTSDVKPAADFKVAAAPATATPDAAPAVKAPAVAEFHARSGDDVYARAQAYVAKNTGPGAGPG